jgi:hypothetical protein
MKTMIKERPVNWTPVGKSIIESIIGFEKGIMDMHYKYHYRKYPDAFLSAEEESLTENIYE